MGHAFVTETHNNRAQRALAILFLAALLGASIFFVVTNLHQRESWYARFAPQLSGDITPLQVFYLSTLGSLVIFPIPAEMAFYFSATSGHSIPLIFALALAGFIIGNFLNYLLGLRFSRQVRYLLSAKKFFALRRKVNKWGVFAILLMNIFPLPSDLLSVGLGTVRYSKKRFLIFVAIGNAIKFAALGYLALTIPGMIG